MSFRPIRIPTTGLPLVRRLFQIINERRHSVDGLARKAGVQRDTIHGWRRKFSPTVANLDAVLNVLGYRLAIVPVDDTRPRDGLDGHIHIRAPSDLMPQIHEIARCEGVSSSSWLRSVIAAAIDRSTPNSSEGVPFQ